MEPGYEYFEHTADVGIRAWGASLDEAFAQAALGLVASMVEAAAVDPREERRLDVEGESEERLLFAVLDELLFVVQTDLWIPSSIAVSRGQGRAEVAMRGEPYEAARHGHIHEIKAITYHDMRVTAEPPEVSVIVDI